jgi:1,4-dihydroxy-2-naphthoyl-CoA hydrolase
MRFAWLPREHSGGTMQLFTKNLSREAERLIASRGLGSLADRMGIEFLELSPEHSVATMPTEGNTQPFGLIHGGAYVVLAETLGSFAANAYAIPQGKMAVGIEINASHSHSVTSGTVTGVCDAIHLGGSLTTHQIVITDEDGHRVSTVRITNFLRRLPDQAAGKLSDR